MTNPKVPPRGTLDTSHRIEEVNHGIDVIISIRSLGFKDLDGPITCYAIMMSFAHLVKELKKRGIDPIDAIQTMPG